MKKMTAVEWLVGKLKGNALKYFEGAVPKTEILISNSTLELLITEAKAIEKEQIINSFMSAYLIGEDWISLEDAENQAEKYYKENYEK